jgi:hypothetical protein
MFSYNLTVWIKGLIMKKKVALVFIGTSKYADFFPRWYDAVSSNLFNNCEKTIFAFSDRATESMFTREDILAFTIPHKPWPFVTLLRFKFIKAALANMKQGGIDNVLFLDADLFPQRNITYEMVFGDGSKPLIGVHHPGNFDNPDWNAFIVSGDSNANINKLGNFETDYVNDKAYHQGCLWGGTLAEVEKMVLGLTDLIDKDIVNNVIADWHDESHMNCWFLNNYDKVRTLPSNFAWPDQPFWHDALSSKGLTPMMLHVDKPHAEFPRFKGGTPDLHKDDLAGVVARLNELGVQIPFVCRACNATEERPLNFNILQEWSIKIPTPESPGTFSMCEVCTRKKDSGVVRVPAAEDPR